MRRYKATFERLNFHFKPALRQTTDVVFETNIPFDNDHIEEFDSALWDAMLEQNPHFKNPKGPLNTGWSSILHVGGKVTRL